ncbi:DUF4262 domain-containing protein [Mesorhizobium australicum]|uniref:DUF4262 domain-containing protein n=1 Tax=Mesorhizobium australicum TaxID=536018 RepID=A0A1X7MPB4_9HYPH|nr:DUF4262 domain-containing protein [Mesorhizobium australicum]SMH26464.1 protein of unknown function [Mesorhizobium australicum]
MTAPGRMREVAQNIDAFGQHLFQIFGQGTAPGFTYTIGNADRGLPELLLIGDFPSRIAAGLLNELGAKMREDGKPLATGLIDIGWSIPVKIRRTGPLARTRYTIQVNRYLGHDCYSVLQVMVCDENGRYPGDPGCDHRYDVDRP